MSSNGESSGQFDADPAFVLYGALVEPERLVYPETSAQEDVLLGRIVGHAGQGGHVAIVDGAYDVPHDGHPWYLRGCRVEATRAYFGENYELADRLTRQALVASDITMLVVTLDADYKVAAMKGNLSDKGNVVRPVYPWEARANRVGGYMIPDGTGRYRPVVDVITVEGDPAHRGGMLESHLTFGNRLHELGVLGTWLVYGEHHATAREAIGIAGGIVKVVSQDTMRVVDPRTGSKWSSSDIIERIKQG